MPASGMTAGLSSKPATGTTPKACDTNGAVASVAAAPTATVSVSAFNTR